MTRTTAATTRATLKAHDAQPFLKWAGGKRRLLPSLLPLVPEAFGRYFEPFLGGGAMFFALRPDDAVLADLNRELIDVYETVRDDLDALVEHMARHRYERDYYYAVRAQDPAELSKLARASRMLFLNRTCFNGLYRVNRRGQFNVPFGRYKDPVICPEERLRAVQAVLQGRALLCGTYLDSLASAEAGDFVYLDPPYQPLSRTARFTSYTSAAFDEDDQAELAATVRGLAERGVRCMVSNSDTPLIRDLYSDFHIDTLMAPRAISRNGAGRQGVAEVVVRTWA